MGVPTEYLVALVLKWTGLGCDNVHRSKTDQKFFRYHVQLCETYCLKTSPLQRKVKSIFFVDLDLIIIEKNWGDLGQLVD